MGRSTDISAAARGWPNLWPMKRTHGLVILSLVAVFVLAIASPGVATEGTTEDETTETTAVPEPIAEGEGPALIAPPADDGVEEQPWTARFIYPALGAITILLIIGLVIGYNHSIRNRYRVVG